MIEPLLEQVTQLDKADRERLITEMVRQSNNTLLTELASLLQQPKKHLWVSAIQVVDAIGYPQNASLLPVVVEHLCDGNWPGWSEAIDVLTKIDPPIIAPLFIEVFMDQGISRNYWTSDIEGICLAFIQMKRDYVATCVPSLVYILTRTEGQEEPDPEILLRALEHSEIASYPFAIPVLINVMKTAKQENVRSFARSLVATFSSGNMEFYLRTLR